MRTPFLCLLAFLVLFSGAVWADEEHLVIGSKAFAESWILGEAMCQLSEDAGAKVEFKKGLGATEIIYQALRSGSVDTYPEYVGTIKQVFLKNVDNPSDADVLTLLARDGIGMSYSMGFTDSFALAISKDIKGIETISDLAQHPELRVAVNTEFAGRKDGWGPLAKAYGLKPTSFSEMQHELCYEAIKGGRVDVINVYTTDAQIRRLGLKVLVDDKKFFPRYDAVMLYRIDLPTRAPKAFAQMQQLVGRISEEQMRKSNELQVMDKQDSRSVARAMLRDCLPEGRQNVAPPAVHRAWDFAQIMRNVGQHLVLVGISLSISICVGIPLGILASRSHLMANLTLSGTGLLQTIPSLALLAFVVPLVGVGIKAALIALFVYSLLPIVRNTYTGLTNIPGNLSEAAEAIGLTRSAQLWQVRLPMASPSILAGIKTSAVINVGTATLAALVGAGGLGQSILQGIALLDHSLIFQGAIPAAALALLVQGFFDLLEKVLVPRGLRL